MQRRNGRVVECGGLENRCTARYRGFESLFLRQLPKRPAHEAGFFHFIPYLCLMAYIIIILVSFFVAGLTFFSGFGLGTLLLPAFLLFLPVKTAVAATAIVHLANNILKVFLVWKHAVWSVVLKFGGPAILAAFGGAMLLDRLSEVPALATYYLGEGEYSVELLKLVIAVLLIGFSAFELSGFLKSMKLNHRYLPVGGLLSGFFGGLSGHQGALRAAFLIKAGLSRDQYIATGVMCSIAVDVTRIFIYGLTFFGKNISTMQESGMLYVLFAGIGAAFAGTFTGSHLVKKVTMRNVRYIVSMGIILLAIALGAGII